MPFPTARTHLEQEALALLARLESVKPFSMHMPMVMAAAISPSAMTAMEEHMRLKCLQLRQLIENFLSWLHSSGGIAASVAMAQRRFAMLRLRFTAMLSQFDIFAEAVTQRSEHDYGIWLSGLDILAEDALSIPGQPYSAPPIVCYLDRGIGAAIRRIRTPLPGGSSNPVTIIRVPRERMIGSSIGASIVHEVGHQAAAFLKLIPALRREFEWRSSEISDNTQVVGAFIRWMPEIISDFWSVGKLGISATLGVMTVVSLPAYFVVRYDDSSTHPVPWLRVKLSAGIGHELHRHQQWGHLASIWEELYPLESAPSSVAVKLQGLEKAIPAAAAIIANHKVSFLGGRRLREIMPTEERRPGQLREHFSNWKQNSKAWAKESPTTVFAVLGQAKIDCLLHAHDESKIVNDCLRRWALRRALDTGAKCAVSIQKESSKQSLKVRNRGVYEPRVS